MYFDKYECPYCGGEFEITSDDYENVDLYEEESFHMECPHCEHLLNIIPSVQIDFEIEKCDCNGIDHEWKPTMTSPKCMTKMRCIHCGAERYPTDEEKIEYNIPSVESYFKELRNEK